MSKTVIHTRIEAFYDCEFFVRLREIPNPWGPRYIQVEFILKYNPRLFDMGYSGPTSWYGIESSVDRARCTAYIQIKADLPDRDA